MITEQRLQEIAKLRAMVSTKALRDATADGRLEEQLFVVGAPNVIDELIAEVRRKRQHGARWIVARMDYDTGTQRLTA
jgi:hypothetical protein